MEFVMPETRILLVHSLTLFREALRALLDSEGGFSVTGETGSAGEIAQLAATGMPDVAIIEAGMPGPGVTEAARQILRCSPKTKILFFCHRTDEDLLFECMQAGASGFLGRDTGAQELVTAIHQVVRGGKFLTPPSLSRFVDGWRGHKKEEGGSFSRALTPREREILKLLAEGNAVKECAAILSLSPKTIEAHKFNLMRKLDLHNKAQLVHYAYQKKIVRLEIAS
jgi:two-component system response regulator NreC